MFKSEQSRDRHVQWGKESLFYERCWEGWVARAVSRHPQKWIKRNQRPKRLRPKTMLLVDVLSNVGLGSASSGWATKAKINKWDFGKPKRFCTKGKLSTEWKRPLTEWEKCLQIIYVLKGLLHKMYKELIQLSIKKKKTKIIQLKTGRGPEQTLL